MLSANTISKRTNSLLRLTRHACCSYLSSKAHLPEQQFDKYACGLTDRLKNCASVDKICRHLRLARDLDSTTPPRVLKGFDAATAEIMVDGTYIKHSIWGTAIARLGGDFFRPCLDKLFRCGTLLDQVLNIKNRLVKVGDKCTVTVLLKDGRAADVNITDEVSPVLNTLDQHEAQGIINEIWQMHMTVLLHLSSGAGRGPEIHTVPPFKDLQFVWNSLRFSMVTSKGNNHGSHSGR